MEPFSTRLEQSQTVRFFARPTVSVLMPVRDVARWVGRAVRSVLDSPQPDLELVVVDDGSRDETPMAVQDAAQGDPRLVLIRSGREGIVAALQKGLCASRGRYLARMDGDDWCDPVRFGAQRQFLDAHPEVGLVGCLVEAHPEPEPGTGLHRYLAWQNSLLTHEQMFADRYVESVLSHATAMVRRDVLEAVGGWRDPGWSEDLDLWLRLMDQGVVFAKLAESWYHWTIRAQAATWSDPRCAPVAMLSGKVHHLFAGPLRDRGEVQLWGVGRSLDRWAAALEARGVQVEALDLNPRGLEARNLPRPDGRPTLACYTSARQRSRVRGLAAEAGWQEGVDLFFVA